MATEPRTITIDPKSELGHALDTAGDEPVVVLLNETRFRVTREPDDPWATYDSAKLRAGLRKVTGPLTPEEGDRIIEGIYRGREEGTRPFDRP